MIKLYVVKNNTLCDRIKQHLSETGICVEELDLDNAVHYSSLVKTYASLNITESEPLKRKVPIAVGGGSIVSGSSIVYELEKLGEIAPRKLHS